MKEEQSGKRGLLVEVIPENTKKNTRDKHLAGRRSVPELVVGATSTGSMEVAILPGTAAGIYYLLACADSTNAVSESNESNNCIVSSTTVQVMGSDLVEISVYDPPATAQVGTDFSVTDTVQNQGNADSGASTTRYYLSLDTIKSPGDTLLTGSRIVPGLAVGAQSMGVLKVTIPSGTALGTYYLLACADDKKWEPESIENNNCIASHTKVQVIP